MTIPWIKLPIKQVTFDMKDLMDVKLTSVAVFRTSLSLIGLMVARRGGNREAGQEACLQHLVGGGLQHSAWPRVSAPQPLWLLL